MKYKCTAYYAQTCIYICRLMHSVIDELSVVSQSHSEESSHRNYSMLLSIMLSRCRKLTSPLISLAMTYAYISLGIKWMVNLSASGALCSSSHMQWWIVMNALAYVFISSKLIQGLASSCAFP